MNGLHGLLPFYLNGTLEPGEKTAFERHLEECASCREALPAMDALRAELAEGGDAVLHEHPSPERLAAVLLDGEDDPVVRAHARPCATCTDEIRWLEGRSPATLTGRGSVRRRPWRFVPAGLAAAALLLVAAMLALYVPRSPGKQTGLMTFALIPPAQRSAIPHIEAHFPSHATVLHLLFEIDRAPADFPLVFRLEDAEGRIVHIARDLGPGDFLHGVFLLFECDRHDCPAGSYRASIAPAGAGGKPTEYAFQVRWDR